MKRTFIILAVLSIITFQSCSDDSSTPTPSDSTTTSGDFVGRWTFERADQKNGEIKLDGILFSTYHSESSAEFGFWDLAADGSYNSEIGYHNTMTMTTAGVEQVTETDIPAFISNGTYTHDKAKNTITVNTGVDKGTYTIQTLTANKMILTLPFTRSVSQGGSTSVTTSTLEMEFSK